MVRMHRASRLVCVLEITHSTRAGHCLPGFMWFHFAHAQYSAKMKSVRSRFLELFLCIIPSSPAICPTKSSDLCLH